MQSGLFLSCKVKLLCKQMETMRTPFCLWIISFWIAVCHLQSSVADPKWISTSSASLCYTLENSPPVNCSYISYKLVVMYFNRLHIYQTPISVWSRCITSIRNAIINIRPSHDQLYHGNPRTLKNMIFALRLASILVYERQRLLHPA